MDETVTTIEGAAVMIISQLTIVAFYTGVAALQTAIRLGPGHRVVTILCDSGMRHLSKFWAQVGDIGGEAKTSLDDVLTGRNVN